uniref:(northern house mosquito) hypothetical protein n=1 Tax=Culex pipiens TaxID=7175 RepID=A0A8D8PE71_CULPI
MALLTENPPCSRPPRIQGRVPTAPCRVSSEDPPPPPTFSNDVSNPEKTDLEPLKYKKWKDGKRSMSYKPGDLVIEPTKHRTEDWPSREVTKNLVRSPAAN